jgi:hypothetical protein
VEIKEREKETPHSYQEIFRSSIIIRLLEVIVCRREDKTADGVSICGRRNEGK